MAQPDDLFDSYEAIGKKEDVSDLIHNISPTDTPFLTAAGTTTATQKLHQWQTDTLAAPTGDNAKIEGDDDALEEQSPTVMLGNQTQISKKTFGISGSLDATALYGREKEFAYKAAKAASELKNDVDMSITGDNNASAEGSASVARVAASLECWLGDNRDSGDGGSAGTASASGCTASTDGTLRAFAQTQLDAVISSAWDNGATPSLIILGANQKENLSAFDGRGAARTDAAEKTIFATADLYVSNFGELKVVPSRHIRKTSSVDRNVFVVDPDYAKVAYFRPWQQYDLAKTGDNDRRSLLVEWTLEVCNPAAHGVIADLQA